MNKHEIRYQPLRLGRARKNFLKKVELLEEWVKLGRVPDDVKVPSGPTELARWKCKTLGLNSWASPNITSPKGPHSDLRARFNKAIRVLLPDEVKRTRSEVKRERDYLRRALTALAEQNTELIERISVLQDELAREKQLKMIAEKRASEANKMLSGSRPVSLYLNERKK